MLIEIRWAGVDHWAGGLSTEEVATMVCMPALKFRTFYSIRDSSVPCPALPCALQDLHASSRPGS
jgi:hypothetical protein